MFNKSANVRNLFDCTTVLEQYQCQSCPNLRTNLLTTLKAHLQEGHNTSQDSTELYQCLNCCFETYSKLLLLKHELFDCCAREEFKCVHCKYKTGRKEYLEEHVEQEHKYRCVLCCFEAQRRTNLLKHQRRVHWSKALICNVCWFGTKDSSMLKHHKILRHGFKGKWLQCGYCPYRCIIRSRMRRHQQAKHKMLELEYHTMENLEDPKDLKCNLCKFKTIDEGELQRHKDGHETITKPKLFKCTEAKLELYECDECNNFKTNFVMCLKEHLKHNHRVGTFTMAQYKCERCSFKTYSRYLLMSHNFFEEQKLKENLNPPPQYVYCDLCSHKAFSKNYLPSHYAIKHAVNPQWYNCQECPFKTRIRHNLIRHLQKHKSRWLCCDSCSYKTKFAHYLKEHRKLKHDIGIRWFHCDLCDFTTKRHYNLKHHKKLKHEVGSGWFQCELCSYRSLSGQGLQQHHRKQHVDNQSVDDKKYQCPYCPHSSKRRYNLKFHIIQKHSDLEDIEWLHCDQCDFKSKTKSILKRHVLERHSEEWVYCAHCSYQAKSKRILLGHLRCVHGENKKKGGRCRHKFCNEK